MILVDTGPLIALFDPRDEMHAHCDRVLKSVKVALRTTVPVLTEAFHILSPASRGSDRLRDFVNLGGLSTWFLDGPALQRVFELMEQYADHPMDLADASLLAAAERLRTRQIFTLDHNDFETYRIRQGHRNYPVQIIG